MHWNADLRHLARLAITRDVRHKRDGLRSQFHSSFNYLSLQSGSDVVYRNHPVRFFTPWFHRSMLSGTSECYGFEGSHDSDDEIRVMAARTGIRVRVDSDEEIGPAR